MIKAPFLRSFASRFFSFLRPVTVSNSVTKFTFQPRWKEELVVGCTDGKFVLEHPMGVSTVILPAQDVWVGSAPDWAINEYPTLKQELSEWCMSHGVVLEVNSTSVIEWLGDPVETLASLLLALKSVERDLKSKGILAKYHGVGKSVLIVNHKAKNGYGKIERHLYSDIRMLVDNRDDTDELLEKFNECVVLSRRLA